MLGLIISALILCGIMFFVARHEAEISLPVVLLIALGVSLVGFFLSLLIGVFALPVVLALLAWALHQFCYLRWSTAWIVTGIYVAVQVAINIMLGVLKS